MERMEVEGPADLLELDPESLSSPAPPGLGEAVQNLWAVCTHGRRDPCCAEYGRRLIRLGFAGEGLRQHLWESSHQGGHRFAANLAIFPHGLFYGMVEAADGDRILQAYLDGRIVLDHYRGRSSLDEIMQAADYLARRDESLTGIDDLIPRSTTDLGEGEYEVAFDGPEGRLAVRLRVTDGTLRPESCNKPKLTPVRLYRKLGITPEGSGSPTV